MAWVQEDLAVLVVHPVNLPISLIASMHPGADHSEWGMNFNKNQRKQLFLHDLLN